MNVNFGKINAFPISSKTAKLFEGREKEGYNNDREICAYFIRDEKFFALTEEDAFDYLRARNCAKGLAGRNGEAFDSLLTDIQDAFILEHRKDLQ